MARIRAGLGGDILGPTRIAVVALVAALCLLFSSQAVAVAGSSDAGDWSMFHSDSAHHGVSPYATIGAASAPTLRPAWRIDLGHGSYSSPAVVFNAALGIRMVYVADAHGDLIALDANTGATVWKFHTPRVSGLSQQIISSPAVYRGVVYFGSDDHRLWAVDATTGARDCSYDTGGLLKSSPVVGETDASGPVVYIGEEGLSDEGSDGGHEWAINGVGNTNGACTLKWVYDDFGVPAGSQNGISGTYSSPALVTDATGRWVVVFGTTDPDDAVYSLDAETGHREWRFQTIVARDSDVGAAPTISAPGTNGFADGVVYITGKEKVVYAIDLTTGARIWEFSIRLDDHVAQQQSTSTAALDGRTVYVGSGVGVYALDAITGAKKWHADTPSAVFSSPAVTGASGDKVVLVGDLGGSVRAFRLSDGDELWHYTSPASGAMFVSSFAVSGGKAFILGTDGYAYAFAPHER